MNHDVIDLTRNAAGSACLQDYGRQWISTMSSIQDISIAIGKDSGNVTYWY